MPDLDAAEHLVGRAEDAAEELEFLGEEFEDALVGGVGLIKEIDDDDVVRSGRSGDSDRCAARRAADSTAGRS